MSSMCYNLPASANACFCLTLAVGGAVTVTCMTTETHLNMHAQTCVHAEHTHVLYCAPETHPPSMLGFARDKQPRCEVRSVYLSCQCAVSVWGCSEWGIEMACWHRTAVQADFAKAVCPQIITSVSQHPRHLSTSQQLRSLPAVARAFGKWAAELNPVLIGDIHTQASHRIYIRFIYYYYISWAEIQIKRTTHTEK